MTTFTVRGYGKFPFDMLRYDRCWPYMSEDAERLAQVADSDTLRTFVLTTDKRMPTVTRWASFGWPVLEAR
jgi:hypothetical protein